MERKNLKMPVSKKTFPGWLSKFVLALVLLGTLPTILPVGCNSPTGEPGEKVDTMRLALKDSIALLKVLQANAVPSKNLHNYIEFYQGRIQVLKLNNLGLKKFSFDPSLSSMDSLRSILLQGNQIETLSVLDTIHTGSPLTINLIGNKLKFVSEEFGKVENIFAVGFDENEITTLPPDINHFDIRSIGIVRNKLCLLPDSIQIWLDKMNSNWRASQICN